MRFRMRKLVLILVAVFALSGCQKQGARLKVLIGATTVPGPGEAPIPDSIVVIEGSEIRSVGERKDVPVPQYSDRTELNNKWIVPVAGSKIEPGATANLMILSHAPVGATPASPSDVSARIKDGEWVVPARK